MNPLSDRLTVPPFTPQATGQAPLVALLGAHDAGRNPDRPSITAAAPPEPGDAPTFGCGPMTPHKLERVRKIVPWILNMSVRHLASYGGTFHYLEANAGPGRYAGPNREPLEGSPVVALKLLYASGVRFRAVLIEQDSVIYKRLEATLHDCGLAGPCVELSDQDNRLALPAACRRPVASQDRGLIFFDPKGAPDFALIDRVMALPGTSTIDVLVNVCTNPLKLERAAATSARFRGRGAWATKDVRPLAQRLATLHKVRVLVGEPTTDPLAWSLILGSNWPRFPEWRAGQMDAWDGPVGQARLRRISLTRAERGES